MIVGINKAEGLKGIDTDELFSESVTAPDFIKLISSDFTQNEKEDYTEAQLEIIKSIKDSDEYKMLDAIDPQTRLTTKTYNIQMYHKIRAYNKKRPKRPTIVATKEAQQLEFDRCKYDIVYYLENYVVFDIAGGTTPMILNDKLRLAARLYEASVLILMMSARQKGKTSIMNACNSHTFNFHANTSMHLINLNVGANKKNLRIIENMLIKLPIYLQTYNPARSDCIANVFEKISAMNSKLNGMVIANDPDSTGRGHTGSLCYDEIAYLKGIEIAYSTLSFVYSAYSHFAAMTATPAPQMIASTPNSLATEEGQFFWSMFSAADEVPYEQIKDLMPFEIKEFLVSQGITATKVFMQWYENILPPEAEYLIDKNDPRNQLDKLENMRTSIVEIYEIHPKLGKWMAEQKQVCLNSPVKIKKDIYCIPPSAMDTSIFDEETLEQLVSYKVNAKFSVPLDGTILNGKLDFLEKLEDINITGGKFVLIVDPAFSISGDHCAFIVMELFSRRTVAEAAVKTGKVKNIYKAIRSIFEFFKGNIAVTVERNNFGQSVIEDCEADPEIRRRLFYIPDVDKKGQRSYKESSTGIYSYGFATTKVSRPLVIEQLINQVNDSPELVRGTKLIGEVNTLIEKSNKVQAMIGAHDDLVMAFSIGLYICAEYKSVILSLLKSGEAIRISYGLASIYNNPNLSSGQMKEDITQMRLSNSDEFKKNHIDPLEEFKNPNKNQTSIDPRKLTKLFVELNT